MTVVTKLAYIKNLACYEISIMKKLRFKKMQNEVT